MEGMNGYQAAEELNKLPDIPLIIFITQSGAYIIRGYEVAFRYLKKPVEYRTLCGQYLPQWLSAPQKASLWPGNAGQFS